MASPNTSFEEKDLSTRVPSAKGLTGAFVIPATKGGLTPVLCSGQSDFKKLFTPNDRIEVGMDSSYFSALKFLEKGPAYIKRVVNGASYGASIVKQSESLITNGSSGAFVDASNNILTINENLGKKLKTGSPLTLTTTGTLPSPLSSSNLYFAYKISDVAIKLCSNLVDALSSNPTFVTITGGGSGNHTLTVKENLLSGLFTSEFVTNQDTFKISSSVGKNIQTGTNVLLSTNGTLPTGLTANTSLFVIKYSETQIAFATTLANAKNNVPIEITGAGSGTFLMLFLGNNPLNLLDNFTINTTDNTIVINSSFGSFMQTGEPVVLDTEGVLTGTGITAGNVYYLVKASNTEFKLATSKANALLGVPTTITLPAQGTGKHYIKKMDSAGQYNGSLDFEAYLFGNDELMLLRQKDPGAWSLPTSSGGVQWTIEDYRDKEDDAFIIKIFKTNNLVEPIETHICSRKHKQDGNGNNIYVEDVLKSSYYLECIDNVLISDTVFPIINTVPVSLNGGDDGEPITDSDMINGLNSFSNPDDIAITLIMDGGWATQSYHQAITQICESRKDCIGILSVPISLEKDSDYLNKIISYRKSLNINSSYVCLYTCHQLIKDNDNNRSIWVSPDGFVGANISQTSANEEVWIPVGGWKRGTILSLETLIKFSKPERDKLYDAGINPTRYKPSKGTAIWGQKTLLNRPSALDRANVRLLLIYIEPANAEALENYEFEINNVGARNEIEAIVSDYMKGIQSRLGVYDYYIVCDSTNNSNASIDNHELEAWLFVKPTISMEYIKLKVIVTRTGTDFATALQLVG